MTTLSHSNFQLHRFLTDQGAFIHTHHPEDFEDTGDGESGPHLSGHPAYDEYAGESHTIFVDSTGLIQHSELIDWHWCNWVDQMIEERGEDRDEWPIYIPPRRAGEDWQVSIRDEDGRWWMQRGQCWTSDRKEAHFFSLFDASQRAARFNERTRNDTSWLTSRAVVVHADECPRCMQRRIEDSTLECGLCGRKLSKIGAQ